MPPADPRPPPSDVELRRTQDFVTRFHQLPGAAHAWTSATYVIVALNTAMFVFMGAVYDAGWFEPASMRAYNLFAASNGAATTDGEWWRLLTSMFAHYGLLHLALNMWALLNVGPFLERLLGRALFWLIYLAAGLQGGLLSIAWNRDRVWSAGASGAVFGLYGALLGWLLHQKHGLPRGLYRPLLTNSLFFAGCNVFFGLTRPGIDNACHLGGFAAGFVLGWLTALPVDRAVRARLAGGRLALAAGLVAAVTATGVAFAPRFNYSVREEFAWSEANRGRPEREQELIRRNNRELLRYQQTGDNRADYATWLTAEMIPFYAEWQQRLAALRLDPGQLTARRAAVIREVLRVKIDGYRQLEHGVRTRDPAGISAYVRAEQEAIRLIRGLDEGRL
ncbi:MAG: rhomboid family intramembrane serine protease [Opitutae bacterium]|nr:rhomboid family intramembrane serine protease [Opitutae bacterium]